MGGHDLIAEFFEVQHLVGSVAVDRCGQAQMAGTEMDLHVAHLHIPSAPAGNLAGGRGRTLRQSSHAQHARDLRMMPFGNYLVFSAFAKETPATLRRL
jgi:hypothetical protein